MALARSSRRRPQQHRRRLFLSSQGRHHVSEAHLKRYLAEFDFRYNNRAALGVDEETRAIAAHKGAAGKRLMY